MNNNIPDKLIIQADNARVFKYKAIVQFFKFLVDLKLVNFVHLDYMLAGHTKFSPDIAFGSTKKNYFKTSD